MTSGRLTRSARDREPAAADRPTPFSRRSRAPNSGTMSAAGVVAAVAEDDRFGDERAPLEDGLDRLRRDLLSAGRHQQILLAIGDRQVAVGVDRADVAGVKPAVLEDLGRGLRLVVVAAHDVRAAREDLAVGRDLQLDVGQPAADGADARRLGRIDGQDRGGLGEAVAFDDRQPHGMEELRDARRQRRAAGHDQPEPASDAVADLGEHEAVGNRRLHRGQRPDATCRGASRGPAPARRRSTSGTPPPWPPTRPAPSRECAPAFSRTRAARP